jgi:type I restriction enzyme, S subunit
LLNPSPFLFASFLLRLRVNRERVLPDFVAQFLNSPAGRLQVERLARPILMCNISPTELASVMVPLPSLEEQATLLAPLRTALDERNRKTKEAIGLLVGINDDVARLVGAVPTTTATSRVFASTTRNLRSVDRMGAQFFHPERAEVLRAVLHMPGTTPTRLDAVVDFVEERGVPAEGETVFGLSAVEPHTGEILPATDDLAAGRRFRTGDLLYSRLRPYLNKVALVTHAGLCSPEFYVLRPKEGIDPGYLAVVLRSPLVLRQVSHMTTGNTHPRVVDEDAKAILVPVPTLPVQQEVAAAMAARRAQAVAAREDAQRNWDAALTAFGASLLG